LIDLRNKELQMDLSQTKLTRTEWQSIEVPVSASDRAVLELIRDGYADVNVRRNANESLLSRLKIESTPEMHAHLYGAYFAPMIAKIASRAANEPLHAFVRADADAVRAAHNGGGIKKKDAMRLSNKSRDVEGARADVAEFEMLALCDRAFAVSAKAQTDYAFCLYTLTHIRRASIAHVNPRVCDFVDTVIAERKRLSPARVEHAVLDAKTLIEQNPYLLRFADSVLYDHQKQLFQLFRHRREGDEDAPQLVLYTAPTGTGKTLSPLGLLQNHRVIFVCAARHVGLSLARAAISLSHRVAFAFGCESAGDVRLHYFAASDYSINKRSGGIGKVDNSNGSKVELMICDVKSYLIAMYYMRAFHDPHDLLLYWDEPTISLDREEHELHATIGAAWRENGVSKVVLSCATLPTEAEIGEVLVGFRARFEGAHTATISSFDCKKSISLLDPAQRLVLPHTLFADYDELARCAAHCVANKSLLRYFDLGEVTRFIARVTGGTDPVVDADFAPARYFGDVEDVTMASVKEYYLDLLLRVPRERWSALHAEVAAGAPLSAGSGVDVVAADAHTLTDGPSIFLAEDVARIGAFCVHRTGLPPAVVAGVRAAIEDNEALQDRIAVLSRGLDDKLGADKNKDKKMASGAAGEERLAPEVRREMERIDALRAQVRTAALPPVYVPNTREHQAKWNADAPFSPHAFVPTIDEVDVCDVMLLDVDASYKMLLLVGVGVFSLQLDPQYIELMKRLAYAQKLFVVIATSDYIYGTNYNFCHGFLGKDLDGMTQQKIVQSIGRIGRGNIQREYTVRVRDGALLRRLLLPAERNVEAENMLRLFV
jgi:hypothetical protein